MTAWKRANKALDTLEAIFLNEDEDTHPSPYPEVLGVGVMNDPVPYVLVTVAEGTAPSIEGIVKRLIPPGRSCPLKFVYRPN